MEVNNGVIYNYYFFIFYMYNLFVYLNNYLSCLFLIKKETP